MIYFIVLIMIFYGIIKYDVNKCITGKHDLYVLIVIILIFISGFAYRLGGDGLQYLLEYNSYHTHDGFGWQALNKYNNRLPGWVFFTKLCRLISKDYWLFKMFHAIVVNILISKAIKRYTNYLFTGLLMYFVLMYFDFNFQILRQSLSVAIFLSVIPYFEKNQWVRYYFITTIAFLIHHSAIICLFFPLIKVLGYNNRVQCLYVFLSLIFILFVDDILMVILTSYTLDESTANLDHYAKQVEIGIGFSFFSNLLLSLIIPFCFLLYYNKKGISHDIYPKQYMIIVYGMIYTMGLYIPILYRFNHYFVLFFYLFYIDIFRTIAVSFYKKFKCGDIRLSLGIYFMVMALAFCLIKSRFYFSPYGNTPYPTWVQYYPYSSVLFEIKDGQREDFFKYIQK